MVGLCGACHSVLGYCPLYHWSWLQGRRLDMFCCVQSPCKADKEDVVGPLHSCFHKVPYKIPINLFKVSCTLFSCNTTLEKNPIL